MTTQIYPNDTEEIQRAKQQMIILQNLIEKEKIEYFDKIHALMQEYEHNIKSWADAYHENYNIAYPTLGDDHDNN